MHGKNHFRGLNSNITAAINELCRENSLVTCHQWEGTASRKPEWLCSGWKCFLSVLIYGWLYRSGLTLLMASSCAWHSLGLQRVTTGWKEVRDSWLAQRSNGNWTLEKKSMRSLNKGDKGKGCILLWAVKLDTCLSSNLILTLIFQLDPSSVDSHYSKENDNVGNTKPLQKQSSRSSQAHVYLAGQTFCHCVGISFLKKKS